MHTNTTKGPNPPTPMISPGTHFPVQIQQSQGPNQTQSQGTIGIGIGLGMGTPVPPVPITSTTPPPASYSLFGGGPQQQHLQGYNSFYGFGGPVSMNRPIQVPPSYYNAPPQTGLPPPPQHVMAPQHAMPHQLVAPPMHHSPFASPFGYTNMYPPSRATPPLPQSTIPQGTDYVALCLTITANSDSIPDLKTIEDYIVSLINPNIKSKPEKKEDQISQDDKVTTNQQQTNPSKEVSETQATKVKEKVIEDPSVNPKAKTNKVYRTKPTQAIDRQTYYEQLSAEIIVQCNALRPSEGDLNKRVQLLAKLQKMVHGQWPGIESKILILILVKMQIPICGSLDLLQMNLGSKVQIWT
jgi:hypothetical protein